MKKLMICVVVSIAACVMGASNMAAQPQNCELDVMTPSDSVSMLLGAAMANAVPADGNDFDFEKFAKGFETSTLTAKMSQDSSFMAGAIIAVKLMAYFSEKIDMNEKVFLNAFKKGLDANRMSPEEAQELSESHQECLLSLYLRRVLQILSSICLIWELMISWVSLSR